jgi:hypothetical protein
MNADTAVTASFTATSSPPTCANTPSLCPPPPTCTSTPSLCPPSNEIELGSAVPQGSKIALKAIVPGAGTIVATGKNLVAFHGAARGPGSVTLKLKLTGGGKKLLRKKGRLKVKVKVVFTPTGGTPGAATKSVTFKSKARKAK